MHSRNNWYCQLRYKIGTRLTLVVFLAAQLCSLGVLLAGGKVYASAPTLSSHTDSNWGDSATNETTGTLTWSTGDVIVAVGVTESGSITLNTPTATGLSFSTVASINVGDNQDCAAYIWTATAGSSSSGTVSATGNNGTGQHGIGVYAFSGSAGLGNNNTLDNSANKTISLTRAYNNSAVITALGDWNAVNDTTVTPSPASGGTIRQAANVASQGTLFLADWLDEGTAGTTSYGITDHTGTVDMSAVVVEVRGIAPTIEQEGFRWRGDDGSETGAGWLASQDSNITRAPDTNTRLRTLLNATDDPSSSQYQLEYKKSTDSTYSKVPLTLPASGAVTYGAVGTFAASSGATSRNPALPTGVTAQSELWAVVGSKNNATHSSSTSNWTKVAQQNSGASWTVSLWRYTGSDATAAASITVTWTGSVASFGQSWRMQ